jgi:thiol:disulfide interchange protein
MQRAFYASLIVLAALLILIGTSWLRRAHEVVPWQTDFKAAQVESQTTGKPMLLDFSAEWCGPCQEMRRTTWSDTHVAAALGNYIPVQIDIDHNSQLAAQFEVRGIPHLVVLNPKGETVKMTEGLLGPEDFLQWLGTTPFHP